MTRLEPGSRLGVFEIVGLLGAGGMGEVYRAHDPRLRRDVALKILPADVAADGERLARFEREAQVLAALNHPHIAAIYGIEDAGALRALVLELVEGRTLAERIRRGPLPLPEAVTVATQIADALDAAHERGIVHRDLKPANVKIAPDGSVKLLDFGLAKVFDTTPPSPTDATTEASMATRAGVVLGTAAYMSPEQARGLTTDKRTDVWAFGCVLYEMLTGRAAIAGETFTDTLARVLEREPDWNRLPSETPASIRRLLRRCLEKDPRRRLRDVGDAGLELGEALTASTEATGVNASARR
jgi:serine/threonine protein kinase